MRTVTVYIAVLPQDYSHADVEVFKTKKDAELYINENAIRGDTQYCQVLERKVDCE